MSDKLDLISMGEKICGFYQEKAKQGGDLADWRRECSLSCEIMLDYLRAESEEREKILFIASLFRERYESSKPPAIPAWCRDIIDFYRD